MGDFLPSYDAAGWNGIVAPRGTPVQVIDKLNKEINTGLADPAVKAHIVELGGEPMPMTRADFGKLITDETEKWAKVVKFAGIKAD